MKAVFVCCLFLACAAVVSPASANPSPKTGNPQARKLYEEATNLYNLREFAAAAEKYKAAALVEPAAILYYNLGQCYRQLEKYEDAIWHYQRYLDTGNPKPERRAAVEQFIQQMKAELDRRAMSMRPTTVETSEPPPSKVAAVEQTSPAAPAPAQVAARESGNPWPVVGWSLVGAGVAGAGAAGWLAWSASGLDDDAKQANRPQLERLALQDRADSRRRIAIGVGIGGGVLLVGGVIALVGPARRGHTASVAWQLVPTQSGVGIAGTF